MRTRTWGVLAFVAVIMAAGLFFSYVVGPVLQERGLLAASDAADIKGTIRIAGDNYLGYWFLTSREFAQRLKGRGYLVGWTNDQGDYAERHRRFAEARYDIMVLPVNSYLTHGGSYRYPGVIPIALSESKGADSIVAYVDRVAGQPDRSPTVNDLNNPNLKICVTPDSPSQFLLDVGIAHFALDDLKAKKSWFVATRGSEDGYTKLKSRACDVAVLWEPDVSKALALPGIVPIFGSDQVSEMIVDVFVLRRQWLSENPEAVDALFTSYFETVAHYSAQRDRLVSEIARDPALNSSEAADRAVARIAWFGLSDNCRDWFNVGLPGVASLSSREKVIDTVRHVTDVMVSIGDLPGDPLAGNPYTITNTEVLKRLCARGGGTGGLGVKAGQYAFAPLGDQEWAVLPPVGRIRVLPISFDASTSRLTREGEAVVNQVAVALGQNYPQYRVLVKGHTAPSGDESANLALSSERAEGVKAHLVSTHGLPPERLRAVGAGSSEPLPRGPGEGELAYRNRLARVEFFLLEDRR